MYDTGLSIGLTLQLGFHADSGPVRLRAQFSAAWGTTEVFTSNVTTWDLTQIKAWRNTSGWSLRFAGTHQIPYGLLLERGNRAPYGDLRQHRRQIAMPYGDARQHW